MSQVNIPITNFKHNKTIINTYKPLVHLVHWLIIRWNIVYYNRVRCGNIFEIKIKIDKIPGDQIYAAFDAYTPIFSHMEIDKLYPHPTDNIKDHTHF